MATAPQVNFVTVRTQLFFYELQELVIELEQPHMDIIRERLGVKLDRLVGVQGVQGSMSCQQFVPLHHLLKPTAAESVCVDLHPRVAAGAHGRGQF